MRRNLKQEIIKTAKRLFGERGYSDISMRDIADALQISVGNLTYHFKKKGMLIEAVILDGALVERKSEPPKTLVQLNDFLADLIEKQLEYPAYFENYTHLAHEYPAIHQMQLLRMEDLKATLQAAFDILQRKELIKKDKLKGQTQYLIDAVMMLCIYGMAWEKTMLYSRSLKKRLAMLWSLLYPNLTKGGKKEFHKKMECSLNEL